MTPDLATPGMLLVIASAPWEYDGFVKREERPAREARWLATSRIGGQAAVLAANGAGGPAASGATRRLLARGGFDAVLSTGFAGALDPSLRIGDIFVAESVLGEGREYKARLPAACPGGARRGMLLSVDEVVVTSRAKRELCSTGAQAVDMEAAAVASEAARHGVAFYCVRSISDDAGRDLPVDFNRTARPDGTFSARLVAREARLDIRRWAGLARLWRDARVASRALGRCLPRCEFGS